MGVRDIEERKLELQSRAASSVGVIYRSSGPNTRSNPGGGRIQKKETAYCSFIPACHVGFDFVDSFFALVSLVKG